MPACSRLLRWALAFVGCLLPLAGAQASPASPDALARAARAAKLATIDPSLADEGDERTMEAWLAALTRGRVRSIDWSGGACRLVIPENPRDAGGAGARCGRAVLRLSRPRSRQDRPEIEVYFDRSTAGKPIVAYAFRGSILGKDGTGPEYTRFTRDFEAVWRERFDGK